LLKRLKQFSGTGRGGAIGNALAVPSYDPASFLNVTLRLDFYPSGPLRVKRRPSGAADLGLFNPQQMV